MTVFPFAASYDAARSKKVLDNFLLTFSRRETIVSSILVYCTSTGSTVLCGISLVYSELDTDGIGTEATHGWLFVVNPL